MWLRGNGGSRLLALLALTALSAASCQADARGEVLRAYVAGGNPEIGRTTFARYGCISCHTIPGVRGARALVGPPLVSWSKRAYIAGMVPNEPGRLVQFIRDPQSVAPGTAMPYLGVSDADARHLAAYLYTLD